MRDLPTGPELRALAEEWAARIDEIPPEERALARAMIGRCHAIADREAAAGEAALEPIRAALSALYGGDESGNLLARLAADIRVGKFDLPGAARDRVRALLQLLTLQKLREANPRYLAAHGIE
ncbi:MAG TPA: DUF6285 domain-containing protein [Stellaceae bacterium]|nr:DUF6285 domain-containing protein [Stellaceae bacterium]